MQIRTMTEKDIPAGTRLKDIAGWNQTEADWRIFLNAGRDGCFVAEVDDVVRGTAATIVYGGRFAWVGMVLVDPENRGHGIGTTLLDRKSTRLNSSHTVISYAVFCLKKKKKIENRLHKPQANDVRTERANIED